jgi:hypothetical protein
VGRTENEVQEYFYKVQEKQHNSAEDKRDSCVTVQQRLKNYI